MVKNVEDIFIRFGETHKRDRRTDGRTDRQTDGKTPHADIYRAYAYAARGKNRYWLSLSTRLSDFSEILRNEAE